MVAHILRNTIRGVADVDEEAVRAVDVYPSAFVGNGGIAFFRRNEGCARFAVKIGYSPVDYGP